jgi:hypothetical protein
MLAGVPDYSETTWFSGANVDGELSVRGLRSLETFIRTPGQSRPSFDERSLRKAAAVGTEILRLFASPDHYRARIGFRKLVEGLKNRQPRGRLHEFVRAIDALMALETASPPGSSSTAAKRLARSRMRMMTVAASMTSGVRRNT